MAFPLFLRSMLVLVLLFGLLFAVGMAAIHYLELPLYTAILFALGIVLLQYAIGPYIVQWIYRIDWMPPEQADPNLAAFMRHCCHQANIPEPRFGVIHDGNPNAFTFGHYPGNARVVVTSGLLEMLDENERQAVVAHELGHIAHWDFVIMTIAATVPLVLYVIFRTTLYGRGRRDRSGGAAVLVGVGAFIAYLISQYIVLLLSRVREYFADSFSARTTHDPNALATSLVKIAYGLAAAPKGEEAKQEERRPALAYADAVRSLGIFDAGTAGALALASGAQGAVAGSTESMVDAMKWDVWNPWGALYEVSSTHPLPAKRIHALDREAELMGQAPAYDFPLSAPESYWDEFLADVAVSLYPLGGLAAGGIIAITLSRLGTGDLLSVTGGIGAILLFLGLGYLLKVKSTHPTGSFPQSQVRELVGEVKVSKVRSVPCQLEGRIIGRGIPGLFWSEDLVLHDGTGFIVLDYQQPINLLTFLFGILRAEKFVGQQVTVQGWYRRGPRPYLELWYMWPQEAGKQTCWVYTANLVLAGLVAAIGLVLFLAGLIGGGP